MARTLRQSKIIEIISSKEVETQEELACELKRAGFEITQATISRDIKELGLIKILSDSKKYKYAFVDSTEQSLSPKYVNILKEVAISVKSAGNIVVVKTMRGGGSIVANSIERLNLESVLGCAFGDEAAIIAVETNEAAKEIENKLNAVFEE